MHSKGVAEAPVRSPLAVFTSVLPGSLPSRISWVTLMEAVARDRLVGRCGDVEVVSAESSFRG